jgi:small-conductance mechanosensitive channel
MSDQPRDWDRELADIDKAIAKMPTPPGPPAGVARSAATPAASPATGPAGMAVRRRDRAATWLWIVLGLALGVALPLWPYAAACGTGLFGYLAVIAMLIISAVLALRTSWRARQGRANALAVVLLVWGLCLAAMAVLPRIGYARASATWMCHAGAPPQG